MGAHDSSRGAQGCSTQTLPEQNNQAPAEELHSSSATPCRVCGDATGICYTSKDAAYCADPDNKLGLKKVREGNVVQGQNGDLWKCLWPSASGHLVFVPKLPEPPPESPFSEKVRRLDAFADQLLAGATPVSDRIIHLRQKARDLDLSLRDTDLLRKLWEARRRRAGAIEMLGPGMAARVTPEKWAWKGIILAGDTNLLASKPKVGKTTLIINAIARWFFGDSEHLGLPFYGPCPSVIIAGTDMPQSLWLRLLHRFGLAEPAGVDGFQLLPNGPICGLFSMDSPIHLDSDGIARLAELTSKYPGCLLLVDSYAKLTNPLGLKEASSDFAGPLGDLQEAVAPYGTTLVVIHHSGRSSADEGAVAASRGTTALPAAVSQCVALSWLNRGKGTADKRIVLQTEGRGSEPLQLLIEQNNDGWRSHGDAAEVFREQRLADAEDGLHDRQGMALDLVRERWDQDRKRTTSGDLIEPLQLRGATSVRIARRTLQQLEKRGLLESRKETTPQGQVVWFWPAGEMDSGHTSAHSVPPV
jgi:hypothetical protein